MTSIPRPLPTPARPVPDRTVLSHDAFFDAAGGSGDRAGPQTALSVEMGRNSVVLAPVPPPADPGTIVLRGAWRVPGFHGMETGPVAARVFLPHLFDITGIDLPGDRLAAAGPPGRPVAEDVARALLSELQAGAPLSLCRDEGDLRGRPVRRFRRQYTRLFRDRFPEPALDGLNALETADLLLANGFAPVLTFTDARLEDGARALRLSTA